VNGDQHPAVALVLRAAATLASDAGKGVDYVDVRLRPGDDAPTRGQLEAALGPADELPRIPGPAFHRLSFRAPAGQIPVTLIAELDDDTGRATTLTARRDEF
jgi:hypothetical protein